ncbi:MAG: hypothetical protein LUH54_04305 [Firmicutes bacterium]|nr:hypothetical protein [Bacillota bacterium]
MKDGDEEVTAMSEINDSPSNAQADARECAEANMRGAKRNIKDTVFSDLFSDKEYLIQLYRVLHPEDEVTTEDDLQYVMLENVLVNDLYNDLGVLVGDRLMILVEAQSTWSVNIVVRSLLYAAKTYQNYIRDTKQSVYATRPLRLPKPELYVLYTKEKRAEKDVISLSEEFFGGERTAIDISVKVITDSWQHDGKPPEGASPDGTSVDIVSQYIIFTHVADEQFRLYGRTDEAVRRAIEICKGRDVLKKYLESKEKEVIDMMMGFYTQDEAFTEYVAYLENEITEKVTQDVTERVTQDVTEDVTEKVTQDVTEKSARRTAERLYGKKMPLDDIAEVVGFDLSVVKKWLNIE